MYNITVINLFVLLTQMLDRMKMYFPQMYQSTKPLRIGYFESDGYMQASPSMTRAIREVKALLEQAGHTVRPNHTLRHT